MTGTTIRNLVIFLLLAVVAVWGLSVMGVDATRLSPERIRAAVVSHGVWAPLAYLVIFGQPFVPLPGSVMIALAGALFGKEWGAAAGLTGATLRACAAFCVARLLGREAVARLLRGRMARLDEQLGEYAFRAVFFIRLIPNVPFDMQNYGLGFSRVRFGPYVLATILGLAPASVAYAYLGDSLTDPAQSWKLIVAVGLLAALLLAQWAWRRTRQVGR